MLQGDSAENRTISLLIVFVGVLMTAVDTTIVVLALPSIDLSLKTTPVNSVWVILSYIVVITVLSSQLGRVADRFGREKIYIIGLVVFVSGSALCGLSPDINFLILSRIFQSIGGAMLGTASGAVISDYFPSNERGKAFGYTSIGWNFGAILGVFLGGFLASIDWRLIFYINVPIGLVVIPIAVLKLKEVFEHKREKIDLTGAVTLGIALLFLVLGASFSMFEGFTVRELLFFIISFMFFMAFVIIEKRNEFPTIDFNLFKSRVFKFSVLASMLQSTANFAILFILILYLQGVRGLDPFTSSIFLLPGYLLGGIVSPFTGKLSDRIGARIPATVGLFTISLGYFLYIIFLGISTPLYYVAIITIFTGIGSALFFPSNNSAIMANAPREKYAMASGLNRMLSNVGMVLSFAIALTVVSSSVPRSTALAIFSGVSIALPEYQGIIFMRGIDAVFVASIIILFIGAFMSASRGKEDRDLMEK